MTRSVRTAAAAVMVGGLGSAGCLGTHKSGCGPAGCGPGGGAGLAARDAQPEGWSRYYNLVDPCWPQRYSAVARAEVIAPFAAQVNNGHVLEQTVWNWHFESGSDVITPAGQVKLDAIAQARPQPDGRVYLQVARDVPVYGPGGLDTVAARREELTAKRADAVRKYLAAQPALQPVAYEVFVHDAPVPGMPADFAGRAYRGQALGYVGGIRTGGATVVGGAGGAVPTTAGPPGGSGPSGPGGSSGTGGPGSGTPGSGSTGPNF